MVKKIIFSIILGLSFFISSFYIGQRNLENKPHYNPLGGYRGSYEPEKWKNGIPYPVYQFGDCFRGCYRYFSFSSILALSVDIVFWTSFVYILLSLPGAKFKKSIIIVTSALLFFGLLHFILVTLGLPSYF